MNAPRSADFAALAVELADAVDEVWVEGDSWDITALREAQAKVRAAASGSGPDTGQARKAGDLTEALNWLRSNWATNSRDWAGDRREAAWYGVLVGWDCEEDHDHDDICGGTSGMDFVARRHVWAPVFVEALRRRRAAVAAAQSRATVQAPDVAAVVEAAKRLERHWYADCRTAFAHTPEGDLITAVRALLGVDTTPDRLAWISEAGETAAVERQARYQETACARRPAEETRDA